MGIIFIPISADEETEAQIDLPSPVVGPGLKSQKLTQPGGAVLMTVMITVIAMVTTSNDNCYCRNREKLVSEKNHVFKTENKEPL